MSPLLAVSPLVSRAFPSLPVFAEQKPPYPQCVVRLAIEVTPMEKFRYGARYVTSGDLAKAADFVFRYVEQLGEAWTGPSVQQLKQEYMEFVHAVATIIPESQVDHFRTKRRPE